VSHPAVPATPRCSSWPARSRPGSSPTCSDSPQRRPTSGATSPVETGPPTHRSAADRPGPST